jgi:uncharacterized peroxidase-related enzyme
MTPSASLHHLPPITLASANEAQAPLLSRAQSQLGFVPHMYARMAHAPGLLSTYLQGYGLFRSASGFSPIEQEVVLLTISQVHGCDYCVAAHSMVATRVAQMDAELLNALREGQPVNDPKLAALQALTQDLVLSRGRPCPDRVAAFQAVGHDERQLLQIVLALAVKVISNFSNHAFDTPLDDAFAPFAVG